MKKFAYLVIMISIILCKFSIKASEVTDNTPSIYSFYDFYDIWAGRTGYEGKTMLTPNAPIGIRIAVQPAQQSEVVFSREKPWEHALLGYPFVLKENNKIRIWYISKPYLDSKRWQICYAESKDGYKWDRPNIGLVEFEGSKENNIISNENQFGLYGVVIDNNSPENERYKTIATGRELFLNGNPLPYSYNNYRKVRDRRKDFKEKGYSPEEIDKEAKFGKVTIRRACSADGIVWKERKNPTVFPGLLDTQNILSYCSEQNEYRLYVRDHLGRRRTIAYTSSSTFGNWPEPRHIYMADNLDQPDHDVYTNCFTREPLDSGQGMHLMFPAFYYRTNDTLDVQLLTSRDGVYWQRPERKSIINQQTGDPNHPLYGRVSASPNLIKLSDDKWGLMYLGVDRKHNYYDFEKRHVLQIDGEYRWAIWQKERISAVQADKLASFGLVEKTLNLGEVTINYQTEEDGWIRIALIDVIGKKSPFFGTPFDELEGFEMHRCDVLAGDSLSKTVTWEGKSDTSSLKGKKVGLCIQMYKAKIFTIKM